VENQSVVLNPLLQLMTNDITGHYFDESIKLKFY